MSYRAAVTNAHWGRYFADESKLKASNTYPTQNIQASYENFLIGSYIKYI